MAVAEKFSSRSPNSELKAPKIKVKPTVVSLAGRNVDQTKAMIAITWNLCLDECLKVREFISPTHFAVFMKAQKDK
jgi:hypothetical protein